MCVTIYYILNTFNTQILPCIVYVYISYNHISYLYF